MPNQRVTDLLKSFTICCGTIAVLVLMHHLLTASGGTLNEYDAWIVLLLYWAVSLLCIYVVWFVLIPLFAFLLWRTLSIGRTDKNPRQDHYLPSQANSNPTR
jgi:hypothetical protein